MEKKDNVLRPYTTNCLIGKELLSDKGCFDPATHLESIPDSNISVKFEEFRYEVVPCGTP
jgi:hypothetical protein